MSGAATANFVSREAGMTSVLLLLLLPPPPPPLLLLLPLLISPARWLYNDTNLPGLDNATSPSAGMVALCDESGQEMPATPLLSSGQSSLPARSCVCWYELVAELEEVEERERGRFSSSPFNNNATMATRSIAAARESFARARPCP
mmetsp:Transcript_46069/g.94238  ORF Transcript_46069/g.94238 Transcript_46069/m.94238 type:complete len:146 (-) Transcript_46069:288-725(-)